MRRPLTVFAAAGAVAAVLLTGCGSGSSNTSTSSQDPKTAFSTGLSGLTDTDVLTLTIKLDTTPENLVAFAKEGPDPSTLDPQVAQEIASAQLVLETKTEDGSKLSAAKPGQSSAKTASRLVFVDGGNTLAEIRFRSDAIYAQAQVKSLLDLFQQSKAYADLAARAAQMPAFVQAFVQGKWVSLDLNALKALAGQFGANASPSSAQSQKLLTDLRALLNRDVTVTRVGTDSNGDHLKLTTQSRQLASDFVQALGTDVPAAGLATGSFKPSTVPDHSVVVDAWVKDGVLSKLAVDVVQFAKPGEAKPGDSLPVVVQFDRSGDDISAPTGATPVDTTQLFTLLGSLAGN